VHAWLDRTKELTGRTPMIYTALAWWSDRKIPEADFDQFKEYPIWIADYSKSHKATEMPGIINKRKQTLWQFADDAKLTVGFKEGLDANLFYGTRADFNKAFGLPQ
jgi:lysozyme